MTVRGSALAARVADWFYPRVCPGCGALSDRPGRHLCWECRRRIELYEEGVCERCGLHAEGGVAHGFVCGACRAAPPSFDRARSAGRFAGVLREQIHLFKYGHALWLTRDLADLLEGCLRAHFAFDEVDAVAPVPLYPARRRERSYNQAAVLARELAGRIGRRCETAALIRIRHTATQTALDAPRRRANMRGAFEAARPERVRHRRILLVDDVMTTGATLNECARVLKKAGAYTVWAVTLARG
ncbi:MAG: ComF family protein [Kiritimatiellae bacterium]|nr:ComF family protein [Kiritimatiellia bacterium]MDD4623582.1 ComF family protein [Kiritimatiellia bacterium]